MKEKGTSAHFVTMHYVDRYYHSHHSQLLHRHSELELFYVINGTGRYMVNGRTWAIQKGNLVICASGILHGEEPFSDNDMETYCCVLKDLQFHPMTEKDFFTLIQHPVLYFPPGDERLGFEHLLLSLASFGKHLPDSASLCGRISEILLDIVLQKLARRHRQDTLLHRNVDDFIDTVIQYLENNYKTSITLKDLGERFHISQSYLSHIFKEQTGYSPIKYASQLKIGEAQSLLMNTDRSVGSISEELGFGDNCHFNVMFKKYTNLSPTEYRRHFRKAQQENT
ncbi:MAG: helix-turn-helix domain-containing protein [Ruminococcus sp.]|jgi:AraC-like DNA-binding protein